MTRRPSLLAMDWNVVVLDEAHKIKNRGTQWSVAARGLSGLDSGERPRKFAFGICATGTPVENSVKDLPVPLQIAVEPRLVEMSRADDFAPYWTGAILHPSANSGVTCSTGFAVATYFFWVETSRGILAPEHCGGGSAGYVDGGFAIAISSNLLADKDRSVLRCVVQSACGLTGFALGRADSTAAWASGGADVGGGEPRAPPKGRSQPVS